jgi:hypothetical protein
VDALKERRWFNFNEGALYSVAGGLASEEAVGMPQDTLRSEGAPMNELKRMDISIH